MKTLALLALLVVGGGEEILDVGALTRPPSPSSFVPRLGCRPLESGCGGFGGAGEDREPEFDPDWLLVALDEAGLLWPVPELHGGGRYIVVSAAEAARVRAALASLAADWLRIVRVKVTVTYPDGVVESAVVAARDGRRTSRAASSRRRFHADSDVEIACSNSAEGAPSVIADPIVITVRDGLAVDLRPFLLGDGEAVAVEAVIQAGRFDAAVPELPLESRFHGRLQMPRYRGVAVAMSGRIDPGEELVLRFAGPDGTYVIRLDARVEGRPGAGPLRRPPGALARASGAPLEPEFEEEGRDWIRRGRVAGSMGPLHGWSDPAHATRGLAWGTDVEVAGAARSLAATVATLARTVRFELRLLAGDEEIGRTELSALDGWTAAARIGRERMIVADWDVEVGCYNQIGDPIVRPAFAGDLVRLRPRLSPDARTILVDLAYRRLETEVRPPPPSGMTRTGPIHPVHVTERDVETDLVLEADREVRIPVGRSADGKPLTLVVRARPSG